MIPTRPQILFTTEHMSPLKKKKKQGLLPVESWIPVPTKKMARRHQRLTGQLKPKAKKKWQPPRWLQKQIRERKQKEEEEAEGARRWIRWYEDRGKTIQTDPVVTYRAMGMPLDSQRCREENLAPNGELMTLSDLDAVVHSSEEEEFVAHGRLYEDDDDEEDSSASTICEHPGGRTSNQTEQSASEESTEEESDGDDDDVPLSKLCSGKKKDPQYPPDKISPVEFSQGLCRNLEELPPPVVARKSTRRAERLKSLAAKVKKRKESMGLF